MDGLGSKFETRNPKPEARNPKPETRNPKPETRNPKPETSLNLKMNTRTPKPLSPEMGNLSKRETRNLINPKSTPGKTEREVVKLTRQLKDVEECLVDPQPMTLNTTKVSYSLDLKSETLQSVLAP